MTIVDKIRNSIQAELGATFPVYYHDDPTLNLLTSQMDFPCALVTLITEGRAVQEGGTLKEIVSSAIFFVEKSDFDFEADANEVIIDRCKQRAFAWLNGLGADPWLTLYNLNRTRRVYDQYDDILTGFGVFVDLKENEGFCDFPPEPDPEPTPEPGNDENENEQP